MEVQNYSYIFRQAINDYHQHDSVDIDAEIPFAAGSFEHLLYRKNWVDTVQWHLEDIIRDPQIIPQAALGLKRRIDASNQLRTDLVELIDVEFMTRFSVHQPPAAATLNTETPAWALDRLSILELKIFHMNLEAYRVDASEAHKNACSGKLKVLLIQRDDLITAIEQLLQDLGTGTKYMKLYKQMKMYNDESLNPVLYQQKN